MVAPPLLEIPMKISRYYTLVPKKIYRKLAAEVIRTAIIA